MVLLASTLLAACGGLEPIVVDNEAIAVPAADLPSVAGEFTATPWLLWDESKTAQGFVGKGYMKARGGGRSGFFNFVATWKPNLPLDGRYRVEVRVPLDGANSPGAQYTIVASGGRAVDLRVDQRRTEGWVPLCEVDGDCTISLDGESRLLLSPEASMEGDVLADAVRFIAAP